jgi:hypothetical protein
MLLDYMGNEILSTANPCPKEDLHRPYLVSRVSPTPADRLRLINTGSRGGTVNERPRRIVTSIISGLLLLGILALLYFTRHYHIRDLIKMNSIRAEGQEAVTRAGDEGALPKEGLSGWPKSLIFETTLVTGKRFERTMTHVGRYTDM